MSLCPLHQTLYDDWQSPSRTAWYSIGGPNTRLIEVGYDRWAPSTISAGRKAQYDQAAARLREILADIREQCADGDKCALIAEPKAAEAWAPCYAGISSFLARTLEAVIEQDIELQEAA